MSADLLRRVGEALYGPRWKSDMARALGVTYRTLQRWCVEGSCPDPVFSKLRVIVRARIEAAEDVRKLLWSEAG